jgi:heme-degrading monooxygenase HmoA
MIQIIWQYEVREAFRAKFELAYGPGGAWSQLFGSSPGYRGTVLLRDAHHPQRYLSIHNWDAEDQHREFLNEHRDEYSSLDATFREWTDVETEVGVYKLLAEATVRPRIGKGRAGASPRGRRGGH